MQQPVYRSAPARPRGPCGLTGGPRAPGHGIAPPCQVWVATGRGAAGFGLRLRARARACGGTEPVDVEARRGKEAEDAAELVAEELEVLEAAAIAGEDEGRRPTDYDRRAHIFEESSRVFRELKQRRDSGGVQDGATAAETTTRGQQKPG